MGHSTKSKRPGADFHDVAPIAGVKTLMQNDASKRARIPLVSFTSDRYLILENDRTPKYLVFYEKGHLVRSIDLMDGPSVHAHEWVTEEKEDGSLETRRKYKSSNRKHRTGLTENERRLVYRIMGMQT